MKASHRLALFGGTFNPVHNGHIALARHVAAHFSLDQVAFLPCFQPVHRNVPNTSVEQRKKMIELAIEPYSELALDCCELDRNGLSYTVETLTEKKFEHPDSVLYWIMGADSFNSFICWKNPEVILQLAHLIVCTRPDISIDETIYPQHYAKNDDDLISNQHGKISFYQELDNPCSSTRIRQQLASANATENPFLRQCLPQPVLEFPQLYKLYE